MFKMMGKAFFVCVISGLTLLLFLVFFAGPLVEKMFTYEVIGFQENYSSAFMMAFDQPLETISPEKMVENGWDEDSIFATLNGYRDPDGYVSIELYREYLAEPIPDTGYGFPNSMKLAVMDEDGNLFISESVSLTLYFSYVIFDFTGHDGVQEEGVIHAFGTATERVPEFVLRMIPDFLIRLALTFAVELVVLFLFGYRKRETYLRVAIINAVTLTFLAARIVLGFYVGGEYDGAYILLFLQERYVFAAEMLLFFFILPEKRRLTGLFYGFAANMASFGLSLLFIYISINDLLP